MATSDRAIPKETPETGVAFRAGVKGLPFSESSGPQPELHVQPDTEPGPNERHMETIERLPGLSDPLAAYEAGRALRMMMVRTTAAPAPLDPVFAMAGSDTVDGGSHLALITSAPARCRRQETCGPNSPTPPPHRTLSLTMVSACRARRPYPSVRARPADPGSTCGPPPESLARHIIHDVKHVEPAVGDELKMKNRLRCHPIAKVFK
jgi:hypothetical protein